MSNKFRKPEEIKAYEKTVPVSTRIRGSLSKELTKISKKNGYPVSKLIAEILEDYVAWLKSQKKS